MKTVQICQAEPVGNQIIPSVIIEISRSLRDGDTTLTQHSSYEEHDAVFMHEASQIEEALHDSLPGGTYDRLCGLMLQRKASHFVVSHNG
jgi:hypothetical protein